MGRGTKNNHCSLTLFLTLRKEGRETRDVTEEKLRGARNNHCSLTLFLTLTLLKEGRGARGETEGKIRAARNNHCSLTLFLTLTLRKELRGTRREERGTNSYLLFTIYCSLFTPAYAKASAGRIHYSLFAIRYSLLPTKEYSHASSSATSPLWFRASGRR